MRFAMDFSVLLLSPTGGSIRGSDHSCGRQGVLYLHISDLTLSNSSDFVCCLKGQV